MIRTATPYDLALVRELWRAFEEEIPDADWRDVDSEEEARALERAIGKDVVLLADDVGLAVAMKRGRRLGFLDMVYVRPDARGRGVAGELVREAAVQLRDRGADILELEVLASNGDARLIYERWGFAPVELMLAAPIDKLVERLGASWTGPTFGSIHVQTDDSAAVEAGNFPACSLNCQPRSVSRNGVPIWVSPPDSSRAMMSIHTNSFAMGLKCTRLTPLTFWANSIMSAMARVISFSNSGSVASVPSICHVSSCSIRSKLPERPAHKNVSSDESADWFPASLQFSAATNWPVSHR